MPVPFKVIGKQVACGFEKIFHWFLNHDCKFGVKIIK
jgi:hypothetical protein